MLFSNPQALAVLEGSAEQPTRESGDTFAYSNDSTLVGFVAVPVSTGQQSSRQPQGSVYIIDGEQPSSFQGQNAILIKEIEEMMSVHNEAGDGQSSDFGSNNHDNNPNDSVDTLILRGRLEAMGSTFSDAGELLTYGNPLSQPDFQDMILHLGPLYDTEWVLSVGGPPPNAASHMWPDLRVLKKVLLNEGTLFNTEHARLTSGDSNPKMLRLGEVYDCLHSQWLEFMGAILLNENDKELTNTLTQGHGADDSDAEVTVDDVAAKVPIQYSEYMERNGIDAGSEVLQNLGWRFSDDDTSVPGWCEAQPLLCNSTDNGRGIQQCTDATGFSVVDMNVHPALRGVSNHEVAIIPTVGLSSCRPVTLNEEEAITIHDALSQDIHHESPEIGLTTFVPVAELPKVRMGTVARDAKKNGRVLTWFGKALIKGGRKAMPHF
ncbi:hypothetical protein T440DRAFT_539390 [Plenodomus tracheiphilus IPT5]|uniref:Uncharacterized protein n=1 Tax=Plenodomus tracheiphilus IPT5 TaxID=1408161 RepID=A0A6A7BL94_9PLEO|nr:hypothetical protein T440DRAFT_539390 [Plenodomus tracheiphilus IPT5]